MQRVCFQYLRRPLSQFSWSSSTHLNHRRVMQFHSTSHYFITKSFDLADIGEGITECQIIQWFVKPGDRVQEFDPLCEVQSDKASVEITSRFEGRISEILYKVDDMAKVGQPLVYIETDDPADNATKRIDSDLEAQIENTSDASMTEKTQTAFAGISTSTIPMESANSEKKSHLATPAVRHMLKVRGIDISEIKGTGKDGRVVKDDVQRFIDTTLSMPPSSADQNASIATVIEDRAIALTPVQTKMFQSMTKSLEIPHLLFSHSVDLTNLLVLRNRVKENASRSFSSNGPMKSEALRSITTLPFIIKVVSHAFETFPMMNAHLNFQTNSEQPQLTFRAKHDFGIAIDSPNGLVVPVIRNVGERSIESIATELLRLGTLALEGRLGPGDFGGATFTISNLGSIGGAVLGPLIIPPMVGILGIGRAEPTPVFEAGKDGEDRLVRKDKAVFNWAADHRVLDGAIVAKCATVVEKHLKDIDCLLAVMK